MEKTDTIHNIKRLIQNTKQLVNIFQLLPPASRNNNRHLFWSCVRNRNFGDWIGPYLFQKMTGINPIHCRPEHKAPIVTYMTAGSIMRHIRADDMAIVWGSGIIHRTDNFRSPKKIFAVRGPITYERCLELGYDCPNVFGDPGILLPLFFQPNRTIRYRLGIIPHFSDFAFVRSMYKSRKNVLIVDVRRPVEAVVGDILSCDLCVSSSLHGIIVSHSYGIKCAWVKFAETMSGDDTKFLDYYQSCSEESVWHDCRYLSNISNRDLIDMAENSPFVKTDRIARLLLEVCPFRQRSVV